MNYVHFSFGPDSRALRNSIRSVIEHAFEPGDKFIVWEEEQAPIIEPYRMELIDQGVVFRQRQASGNLRGSKQVVLDNLQQLLASNLDGSGDIWKIDSDTLCLGHGWRDAIKADLSIEMLGGQSQAHGHAEDALYGFTRFAKASVLKRILDSSDQWEEGWPEDYVISREAYRLGARIVSHPYNPKLGWAGYNYQGTSADVQHYSYFEWITFGNRFLINGLDKRIVVAETMERYIHGINLIHA
jgi:hypothetical protein